MQRLLPWLYVCIALGGGYGALRYATNSSQGPAPDDEPAAPGFKDVLKNPDRAMRRLAESQAELERSQDNAAEWSDAEVTKALQSYLFEGNDSHAAFAAALTLKSLGPRIHAPLQKILADPALRESLLVESDDESPFTRACDLLEKTAPASFVPLLESFLSEKSDEVRKRLALILGSTGDPQAIPGLRRALVDEDEYVRSYALMGLDRAVEDHRLQPAVSKELFDDLAQMIAVEHDVRDAAELLLQFDLERAKATLLTDRYLSADYPESHRLLDAFVRRQVSVPRAQLNAPPKSVETRDLEDFPNDYLVGSALQLLGRHRDPADRETLERYSQHQAEEVAEGAGNGLVSWHGLEGFYERIGEIAETKGEAALTKEQREFGSMMWLDGEVRNGGFSQYFFNSSGRTWQDALNGFEVLGLKDRAAILREAVAKFGAEPPATDRDKRMGQLALIEEADESPFDKLDTRYYACKPSLYAAALRYVVQNPAAFK